MKNSVKLFIGIFAIGMIALMSCKKSKIDVSPTARLQGKWKMVKVATDANNNNVIDASELSAAPDSLQPSFNFSSDGTGSISTDIFGLAFSIPLTWSLINNDQDLSIKIAAGAFPLPDSISTDASVMHIEILSFKDLVTKETATAGGATTSSWTIFQKQ